MNTPNLFILLTGATVPVGAAVGDTLFVVVDTLFVAGVAWVDDAFDVAPVVVGALEVGDDPL